MQHSDGREHLPNHVEETNKSLAHGMAVAVTVARFRSVQVAQERANIMQERANIILSNTFWMSREKRVELAHIMVAAAFEGGGELTL